MAPSATEMTLPVTMKKQEHRSGDPNLAFSSDAETKPPTFEDKYEERKFLKHRLALAYRIFAQNGFSDGVAGHITVRDPVDPTSFWVNPFGKFAYPRVRGGRVANIQGRFTLLSHNG